MTTKTLPKVTTLRPATQPHRADGPLQQRLNLLIAQVGVAAAAAGSLVGGGIETPRDRQCADCLPIILDNVREELEHLACEEEYQRGRSLIERLANSTHGQGNPTPPLSPADCADVLYFVRSSEPVVPRTWWKDPDDEPSHLVGFCVVLEAVERSLRAKVRS